MNGYKANASRLSGRPAVPLSGMQQPGSLGRPGASSSTSSAPSATLSASNVKGTNVPKGEGIVEKAKDFWKDLMEKQGPLIIFLMVVLLVFVIVIIYITFILKNSNLKGKVLLAKPVKMNDLSVPFEISGSDIPKPSVGREYSIGFWLYLESYEQTPSNHKLLFFRGASSEDVAKANPIVMMDAFTNKMYVVIKTQDSVLANISKQSVSGETAVSDATVDLRKIINKNYFKSANPDPDAFAEYNKHIIMEIDYVPLQRWVNVVVVIDNKIVTVFLDGEIYSVKSTDELRAIHPPKPDSQGNVHPLTLIVDKTDGDMFVGKNPVNDRITVSGYLSKIEFHNYAASINQIKSIYNSGPLSSGLLSSMGLQYGVRSPIYKLNEEVK